MYGRGWAYYFAARSHVPNSPVIRGEVGPSSPEAAGDAWMFARLAIVLAIVFAALACILRAVH
jgi:hypothetical protein